MGFQSGNAEGGEKKNEVFSVVLAFEVGWGQGFGGLILVLLVWCGLGTTVFPSFPYLVFFFLAVFCVKNRGCDDRSMSSRCPVGGFSLHPFLGFKPDKLHPVVFRQFAILGTCVMQQFRDRKPVCILFDSILILPHLSLCFASDRCSQVCTGLLANSICCPLGVGHF